MNYPSTAYSWDILSEDVAVKHMDKSTFLHSEMNIPKDVYSYFNLPEKGISTPKSITLMLGETSFDAHIQRDAASKRYRLLWKSNFSEQLVERFPQVYRMHALGKEIDGQKPLMRFERIQPDVYKIDFVEYGISKNDADSEFKEWTGQELEAAVYAYFIMLNKELSGKAYNKAEVNRRLRRLELSERSRGSIEFLMQNISSVLQELCHPIIQGYLPRANVGSDVSERIRKVVFQRKFLNERDYTPTSDQRELDKSVSSLLRKRLAGKPPGRRNPDKQQSSQTVFERDPLVKAWVLQHANGICELCGEKGPFQNAAGEWYLEGHHVIPLAEGGADVIENTVALCPNCHRKSHLSPDAEAIKKELQYTIDRINTL